MKILFTQHVSALGGSGRSLLELINNLPKDIEVAVLCPEGKYAELLRSHGIKTHTILGMPQFNNSMLMPYRNLRWLILLREFFFLPFLFFKLKKLKKEKFDIVHVNEITQIYSLILAKKLLNAKTIMHVRVMMSKKKNLRYKWLLAIFKTYADEIIAIDESVKSTLDDSLNVKVIHNGMSLENIHPQKIKRERFTVGIVANFQRAKGILEYIDAANICINEKKLDIEFHIYGAEYNNIYSLKERIYQLFGFRENIQDIVKEKIEKYGLHNKIKLVGFVSNHNDIYNNIDVLVFPGYSNAVGRPVFEAGFYNVPSIVAISQPYNDTIVPNVTGIVIENTLPLSIANSIENLYFNKDKLLFLGLNSHKLSHTFFNSEKNSFEIYEIYKILLFKETAND